MARVKNGIIVALLWGLVGCSVINGPGHFDSRAKQMDLVRENVRTDAFELAIYWPTQQPEGEVLHVYLAGDGLPWLLTYFVNKDPTIGSPLMLQLMGLDGAHPRLYVARPCYNGFAQSCGGSTWWTFSRHHSQIVEAMSQAIRQYQQQHGYARLRLFGHSGGGALAMLIAARLANETEAVLTVAGNLDIDAWTDYHGYTPLFNSLNPADQPPLPGHIRQWHLLGDQDRNIAPVLVLPWLRALPEQRLFTRFPTHQHRCCWVDDWRMIIRQFTDPAWQPPPRNADS